MSGVTGGPPPPTTKLAIFYRGGYESQLLVNATGYGTDKKWELFEKQMRFGLAQRGYTSDKFHYLEFQVSAPARLVRTIKILSNSDGNAGLGPRLPIRPVNFRAQHIVVYSCRPGIQTPSWRYRWSWASLPCSTSQVTAQRKQLPQIDLAHKLTLVSS